jgi:hypothetical protein
MLSKKDTVTGLEDDWDLDGSAMVRLLGWHNRTSLPTPMTSTHARDIQALLLLEQQK